MFDNRTLFAASCKKCTVVKGSNLNYQGCGPGYDGESSNLAFMVGAYNAYQIFKNFPNFTDYRQTWCGLLMHEIGHCFGLHHTWLPNQQGNFPDIYPDISGSCNVGGSNCSNNVMNYANVLNYLSPLQIGQMHRLLMGSWRSKQLIVDYDPNSTIVITGAEQWVAGKIIKNDIILEPGSELTVECKLIMAPGSKILAKQGTKLIVESGGHISGKYNSCGTNRSWTGIEALGTPLASQFDETQQGVVELKNGAVIELAEIGVSLHRRHPVDLGGGILRADGASFINNQTAISFWDYNNFLPIVSQPDFRNLSRVKDCSFTVNDDFPEAEFNAPYFLAHIGLFEVRGISISGCTFTDTRTTPINLPGNVLAELSIQDVNGQTIAVLPIVPGQATASWDSRPYPAGLYFYTLHLPNRRLATQKLVILR